MAYTRWSLVDDTLDIGIGEGTGEGASDVLERRADGTWPWDDRREGVRHIVTWPTSFAPLLPQDCSGMFAHMPNLTDVDLSLADVSHVADMTGMFEGDAALVRADFSSCYGDADRVRHVTRMFSGCASLAQNPFAFDLRGHELMLCLCLDVEDALAGTPFEGAHVAYGMPGDPNGWTGVTGGVIWHLDRDSVQPFGALLLAPLEGRVGELPAPERTIDGIPQWPWRVAAARAYPEICETDPETGECYLPYDGFVCSDRAYVDGTIVLPEDASCLLAGCLHNDEGWLDHFDASHVRRAEGVYANSEAELWRRDGCEGFLPWMEG